MRLSVEAIVASVFMMFLGVCDGAAEPAQLVVEGRTRTYLLERPVAQGPRPTIILLHGYTGTGALIAQQTGLVQPAKQAGFVMVFPDGPGGRWNFLPSDKQTAQYTQLFKASGGVPDDVTFLKMLVSDLVKRGISDPNRIYLAGRSLGGVMTLRMVCADAGMFAAIALLMSAMPEENGEDCRPARPLPVLMVNVTKDPLVPYGGGRIAQAVLPSGVTNVWSTERLVAFFRQLDGCSDPPEQSVSPGRNPEAPTVEVQRWAKCSSGSVIFHRVIADKHVIPPTLNPGQLLVDFFRDKSR